MLTPRNERPVSLGDGIEALHRQTPRTGLVVVVSDFLDGLDEDGLGPGAPEWEEPLRRLAEWFQPRTRSRPNHRISRPRPGRSSASSSTVGRARWICSIPNRN